jgi:hypothetical protein
MKSLKTLTDAIKVNKKDSYMLMVGQNKLKSKAYNTGELRKAAKSRPAWKGLAGRNTVAYLFPTSVTKF